MNSIFDNLLKESQKATESLNNQKTIFSSVLREIDKLDITDENKKDIAYLKANFSSLIKNGEAENIEEINNIVNRIKQKYARKDTK